jgi:hypothetical protein
MTICLMYIFDLFYFGIQSLFYMYGSTYLIYFILEFNLYFICMGFFYVNIYMII